ncbi:MAG: glycosyltransferase family 25 protein [Pirellulaceae bacterium]
MVNLKSTFERVVCINLDRRPDRWEEFQREWARVEGCFGELERVRAVDGEKVPPPEWYRGNRGAWGCLQSHVRILEDALQDGRQSVLILEDDAVFIAGFVRLAEAFFEQLPDDWDGVMLGGQHLKSPTVVTEDIVRVTNGNRTHAHALRGRYIEKVYRYLQEYQRYAQVRSQHVDHRLGELHESGEYNIYAPAAWLVGQREGRSDISNRRVRTRYWHGTEGSELGNMASDSNARGCCE